MTANWKIVRATLAWLLVALVTLGIVVASPYATRSSAASASYPKVTSCKGLTVKKTGKVWATFRDKDGKRVSYTGIAKNSNGWWRTVNGVVDFSYTGFAKNDNGWYRITKGYVNFSANGIYKNPDNGKWYKTTKGKVTWNETGIFKNFDNNTWWKVTNSRINFNENGVFKNYNNNTWWKVKNSKVDFSFTGFASNDKGLWYIENGQVQFDANGVYADNGKYYDVKNGKATEIDRKTAVVAAAKELSDTEFLSRAMLTEILTDEEVGFTKEEVDYAIDKLNINFYNNVLFASEQVLGDWDAKEYNGISKDLYLQIMKEDLLFTDDEVEYAHSVVEKDANKEGGYWLAQCNAAAKWFQEMCEDNPDLSWNKADLSSYLKELLFTNQQITKTVNEFFPG